MDVGEWSINTKVLTAQLFGESFDEHAHLDRSPLVYFHFDLFSDLVLIEEVFKLCVECLGIMDIVGL